MREWAPEHLVTAEQATTLVAEQFPTLAGAPVEPLATGWDNTVYLVDGRYVFRFPRRTVAIPLARKELALLPRIADRVPLPIPVPTFIGTASGDYPWPFWGAPLVPGVELAEAGVAEAARVPIASSLGEFLRTLHGPELAELAADLPVDPMGRGNPALRAGMARERLALLGIDSAAGLLAEGERAGVSADPPVLAHGDLHVRHLLVSDGRASGVIDWGDVCRADPAVDVSLAYAAFSGPARAAFFDAYGPIDERREVRARVLAVFLCAVLAEYAADERRDTLLREALAGIARSIA